MSLAVAQKNADMRARMLVEQAKDSAMTLGSALAGGQYGGVDMWGRQINNLAHHAEQLQHFQGYTYAIIRTIASRIARQPLRVARLHKQGKISEMRRSGIWVRTPHREKVPLCLRDHAANAEILDDHQLIDGFENPNPIMVRWTLMFVTICALELCGKGYWWLKDRDGPGSDTPEIWPIPPSWMEPVHDPENDRLYVGWKVRPAGTGETMFLSGRDVVYFYYPDPADPLNALSPLQALARTVLSDESLEEAQRRSFMNGVTPGLAITIGRHPEVAGVDNNSRPILSTEQRAQILTLIKQQYRGVVNQDEPLILDGLIEDVKKITNAPREMDFLNSGTSTKGRLAQGWGVNPISMGEIEGANRASSAVADDHLLANVVNPRIEMMSEVLTKAVGPIYAQGDERLLVYLEPGKSVDIDYDLKVEDLMIQRATMSRNEWRQRHGLPMLENGDNVVLSNGTLFPVMAAEVDDGKGFTKRRPARTQKSARLQGMIDTGGILTLAKALGERESVQMLFNLQRQEEIKMHRDLTSFFIGKGYHLTSELKGILRTGRSLNRLDVSRAMHKEEWTEGLKEVAKPHLERIALAGAMFEWEMNQRRKEADLERWEKGFFDVVFALPRMIAGKIGSWVSSLLGLDSWAGIITTTEEQIQESLDQHSADGKEGDHLAEAAVADVIGHDTAADRAASIAAVESTTALGGGQQLSRDVLEQRGIIAGKKWMSMADNKVRDTHRSAHGQEVLASDPFLVGGYTCDHPGDPNLPAGERCGCRCVALSITR